MRSFPIRSVITVVLAIIAIPAFAGLELDRVDFGVRGHVSTAGGVPTNDMPGFGLFAHYQLNELWSLGFSIDSTESDFEQPAKLMDLGPTSIVDATVESTAFGIWLERNYRRAERPTSWFWGVGLGFASIDVSDAAGPRQGGGNYHITTDADSEILASISGGVRRSFGERWFLEFALRGDEHFTDWRMTDRVSGRTEEINDYFAYGAQLGLGFRF